MSGAAGRGRVAWGPGGGRAGWIRAPPSPADDAACFHRAPADGGSRADQGSVRGSQSGVRKHGGERARGAAAAGTGLPPCHRRHNRNSPLTHKISLHRGIPSAVAKLPVSCHLCGLR